MARHGELRASDSDRDRVVDRLRTAAAEGRLAAEELDERVRDALVAVTLGDLERLVRDLPSPRRRAPADRGPASARRTVGGVAVAAVRANPLFIVLLIPLVAVTGAMLIAVSAVWAVFMVMLMVAGARVRGGPWDLIWDRRDRRSLR
jgi:hypothetical protein